ncbi:MAG: hypothetical protein JXM79_11865 [Sedimentisphaerales bacterium]|nr:hypothetical protein [Sedimentisphaerales bacterium]
MKRLMILLLVLTGPVCVVWSITHEYSRQITVLSDNILFKAQELADKTDAPVFRSDEAEEVLAELKGLIQEYETLMVFAESPYPGEILLGTTPPGDDTWLETHCTTRYDGPLKEIRIRRTGHEAEYLRINDIEITYMTPAGPQRETFNKNGRVRLYSDGIFRLILHKPMRIMRIRILIHHESTGLQIYGIPFHSPSHPQAGPVQNVEPQQPPAEVLLGTTPGGKDTWLETLCTNPYNRPVKEIRIKRTGRKASYLRINDIEVTAWAPKGKRKIVFNQNGRVKLRPGSVYTLPLPHPMQVAHIRILIAHESTGLEVYGVY